MSCDFSSFTLKAPTRSTQPTRHVRGNCNTRAGRDVANCQHKTPNQLGPVLLEANLDAGSIMLEQSDFVAYWAWEDKAQGYVVQLRLWQERNIAGPGIQEMWRADTG